MDQGLVEFDKKSIGAGAEAPIDGSAVSLFGLRIDRVGFSAALDRCLQIARGPGVRLVMTPNVDHVLRAQKSPEFMAQCAHADFAVADGQWLVWASRWLGAGLPERVAGSDLMPALCVAGAQRGLLSYFVGGNPGDAERAAAVLAERAGQRVCVGVDCPPIGFETDTAYVDGLLARIAAVRPAMLFVGLGSPKQERFMVAIRDRVQVPLLMGVGVTFSFIAGTVRRAPRLFRHTGTEWVWRLCCEPRRLWRRYVSGMFMFPWLVLRTWWRR